MAQKLTATAKSVADQTSKCPIIALEIEGVTEIFSSGPLKKIARYGDAGLDYGDAGFVYGGFVQLDNNKTYIDLRSTTNNLTQQLNQDESEVTSNTNFTVGLVDKNSEVSNLIRQQSTTDIMSKECTIRLGLDGTAYPEDYIVIFVGNIIDVSADQGLVKFMFQHPEGRKESVPFVKQNTTLSSAIDASTLSIPVDSGSSFLTSVTDFRTFLRIDDELIEYTVAPGVSTITASTRGALGTTASSHDDESPVESFYLLGDSSDSSGNAISLSLRVMLSDGTNGSFASDTITSFVDLGGNPSDVNSIYFNCVDVASKYGLTPGDTFSITGATNGANNVTDAVITSITSFPDGSSIILAAAETFILEVGSGATINFKSQYANLPGGLALSPSQIDVAEHQRIIDLFATSVPNVELQIDDDLTGKDIINRELLLVSGAYNIPRKGKISLAKFSPPLVLSEIPVLTDVNVTNASKLRVKRSTQTNFYNNVVFKYGRDPISGRFKKGLVNSSATSFSKIPKKGNVVRTIESRSLVDNTATQGVLNSIGTAILDRFQLGAELIPDVQVTFKAGWNIDVGDGVILEGLSLTDTKKNQKGLAARVFEVTNKSFKITGGNVSLELTDTGFSLDGRFGVIAPSSIVGSGSTTSSIVITRSFGTETFEKERDKWEDNIGRKILVHSPDYSFSEVVTLTGFDPGDDNKMQVSPSLSAAPTSGYVVDVPNYDSADDFQKAAYCFLDPSITVSSGSSSTVFDVSDATKFFEDAIVKVHSTDYSVNSIETQVTDVTGSTITVADSLGFTPSSGQIVELIGFVSDEGLPYRWF